MIKLEIEFNFDPICQSSMDPLRFEDVASALSTNPSQATAFRVGGHTKATVGIIRVITSPALSLVG